MNVCGYGFNMMFLHKSSLMEPTKEPDLYLGLSVFFPHDLSRPVGETFLFGVDNLMEGSAGLGKPVLVIPGVGVSVAIPAGVQLRQIVDTVSEHLAGLVSHVAVAPVVDHHVVHDVLDVRLELLKYPILHGLALGHHLVQVNVSLQKELCSPLLLPEAGEGLSVSRVDDPVLAYCGLPVLEGNTVSGGFG